MQHDIAARPNWPIAVLLVVHGTAVTIPPQILQYSLRAFPFFRACRAVACLFGLFLIITVVWSTFDKRLDALFERRGKRGLRIVLRAVKEELLALGLISLILTGCKVWQGVYHIKLACKDPFLACMDAAWND